MIPFEKQVCSLDLYRRLKELGVEQESVFYWCTISGTNQADLRPAIVWFGKELDLGHVYGEEISAFTVAELGEMLPERCESFKGNESGKWYCEYDDLRQSNIVRANTEADARARCLLYLLDNRLVTL